MAPCPESPLVRVDCSRKPRTFSIGSRIRRAARRQSTKVLLCLFRGFGFALCVIGAEAILEKILGKDAKKELAHVDMKAKLLEAGLKHFGKYPSLWPPTLAVRVCVWP